MKRESKTRKDDRPFYAGRERYARWEDIPERYRVRHIEPADPWAAFG